MSQSPDIKVRLTPQGVTDVIQALRQVQREADKAGAKSRHSLAGVDAILGSIRSALPALGFTAAVTGFAVLAKGAAHFADEMGKGAQRVGTTAESLSVLSSAAATADVEQGALTLSLGRLAKNLGELKRGTDEQVESFDQLGLSAKDFAGKDTVQAFDLIAGRLARMEDGTEKTELAIRIFGRSGAALIPLLNDLGNKGFAEVRKEAEKLGIVVSTDLALAAEAMNDSFTLMGQQAKGLALAFIAGLAPAIVDTFTTLQDETSGDGVKAMEEFGAAVGRIFGPVIAMFRLLGDVVGNIIGGIVTELGGAAAALAAIGRGEFALAGRIIVDTLTDAKNRGIKTFEELFEDGRKIVEQFTKDIKPIPVKVKARADPDSVDAVVEDLATRFKKVMGKSTIVDFKDAQDIQQKRAQINETIRENEAKLIEELARIRFEGGEKLLRTEQQLGLAELAQLGIRTKARRDAYLTELSIIRARDQAVEAQIRKQYGTTKIGDQLLLELEKESAKGRLAVEIKYIEDLLKLRDTYVQKYKSSADAIKSLDAEVRNNRKSDEELIRGARLELLTEEGKFAQLQREAREKLEELQGAALRGNIDKARELRTDVEKIAADLLRLQPQGIDKKSVVAIGEKILGESRELLELVIAQKRLNEQAEGAAAAAGANLVTGQLEKAKTQVDALVKQASEQAIALNVGIAPDAMQRMIADVRASLGQERFFINVSPIVAAAQGGPIPALASGGRVRGSSPSPTADNIIMRGTAGEFMQPVRAVQYYGLDFMEAIRRMELPRFAEGGAVGGAAGVAGDVMHLELSINRRAAGRVSGSRDTIRALVDALQETGRGT